VVPDKSTIQRLVERFREIGSIGEKRRSGRPSVLSNDSLEDIRARLLQSPRKSLRKLSQETGTLMKLGLLTVLLRHGLRDFWITLYNTVNNSTALITS
jgi:transposase